MPTTYFWAVSSSGKVYSLSSNGQQWEELRYYGVDLKRVSAVDRCIWAIGGDHQVYVYVLASEVPIRFQEIAYENQRWNPKDGFCDRLLFTDRPRWSTQDGLHPRYQDTIKLPTLSWQWEDVWTIVDNLDGQPLGAEGWMYAVDFPMTYVPEKKLMSLVRRRKWVRYRRYVAMDKWTSVPSIHPDPVQEPFIDLAIGGLELPGGDNDTLSMWAVTVQSRIMFRHNVTYNNPEGDHWSHISAPRGMEVNQVSVGPTGLVWAVVWDGKALVRTGVTRFRNTGLDWKEVDFPNEWSRLLQVSVGTNVVWAVSRDGKVWFRKGINGTDSGTSDECACGVGWVEMVGSMSHVSVGPNDQVWAVSKEDQNTLFFRTGVNSQELSGKTWKAITVPVCNRLSPTNSEASLSIHLSQSMLAPVGGEQIPENAVVTEQLNCERDGGISETDSSAPSNEDVFVYKVEENNGRFDNSNNAASEDRGLTDNTFTPEKSCEPKSRAQSLVAGDYPKSPRLSRGSKTSLQGSIAGLVDEYFEEQDLDFVWCWTSGGGCGIDITQLPNWFSTGMSALWTHRKEPWRKDLVWKLGARYEKEVKSFTTYEFAIEKTSWTKIGKSQIWADSKQLLECHVELEQIASEKGLDAGSLTCMYTHNGFKKIQTSLLDITCVMPTGERNKQLGLAVYTAERTRSNTPIRLLFNSDTETEDWVALLNTTCCDVHEICGAPNSDAIWATSNRGDIFAHNPEMTVDTTAPSQMFWRQLGGHLQLVETCAVGVVWGIGYNHVVWVYTGGWGGGLFQGLATSPSGVHPMTDVRSMFIYENQRWNPVTGFSIRGLPTDRYMWSDRSGKNECTKENTNVPSKHWQWITDWSVDFNTPNGVDKEGWQYAKDFPRSYHARKGFADYVRRRRWCRKCKLVTSGPWTELESVRLLDISFQVDHSGNPSQYVNTWAVDVNGNVLFRHGVTKCCPQGTSWEHVTTDQKFISISVGGNGRVWGVAHNGSAFLRNGINSTNPTGVHWFHVEPPNKDNPLRQVSAGATSVWAVDKNNSLWLRQEVMQMFPEGTSWKHVCTNVRKVNVGPYDHQVWAISESAAGSAFGSVCRRTNVTDDDKMGSGWECVTGSGWCHVSVRGCVHRNPEANT